MTSSFIFDEQYVKTMRRVWDFSQNDQRPAVLEWLSRLGPAEAILDIGPGDAYYMDLVCPTSCSLVEPNAELRAMAAHRCAGFCDDVRVFSSVAELLSHEGSFFYDTVLMIHVLFYMTTLEIEMLLASMKAKRVAMVHPFLESSVTVEFEESIGLRACRDRVDLKRKCLGEPTTRKLVNSHFRLPISVPDEDLAFLVAHPTLNGEYAAARLAKAKLFVRARRAQWTKSTYLELPQAQVLETYNL